MNNWWNDYITIPYKKMGRDKNGLDCWGLVRMIYQDQFDIELPSYTDQYNADDTHASLAELIAISKESWTKTNNPVVGDVLILRAEGTLSHVGVVISPTHFIHVIEDINVAIERYDQGKWKNRLEGAYRYDSNLANGDVSVVACPNPLKNVRIDGHVPANSTINEIVEYIKKEYASDVNVKNNVVIMVNGVPVPQDQWDMKPIDGDMIQYRAVAGKGALRIVLSIAVVIAAAYFAPAVLSGLGIGATTTTLAVAQAAISIVGTLLINAIFPIRPPTVKDAGTSQSQNLLQGGSNQPNPYGAIPVVLGKIRFTAPLGAQIYAEANTDTSYLRMLLVWGYGALQISDMRIGATDINTLEELEIETLSGIDDPLVSKDRFNAIYPNDVEQQIINTQLPAELTDRIISSISRTSNVVTVITTVAHTYIADRNVTITNVTGFNGTFLVTEITNATTFKFAQTGTNATGTVSGTSTASQIVNPWVERTINELCTSINVILHFPLGLRQIQAEGDGAGNIKALPFTADVQVRQVDPNTLAPLEAWGNVINRVKTTNINLDSAFYGSAAGSNYFNNIPTPVYQWTSIILDRFNKLIVRKGAYTNNPANDPSGDLLTKLQRDTRNLNTTYSRLATIQAGETEIWRVCMYGAKVFSTVDLRSSIVGSYSGLGLTTRTNTSSAYLNVAATVSSSATLATGSISLTGLDQTVMIGGTNQEFLKRKDAFSYNVLFQLAYGKYQVRIRRNTATINEVVIGGNKHNNYYDCILTAMTAFGNTKPVVEPKPLAMSALRVKATDQFNGSLEGISATVQSLCLDWDSVTSGWVVRATRNPASLFRYVLQHPANAKAVSDAQIDLDALVEWHAYCDTNYFTYDAVINNARSLLDVLKDICAAGRSSPTLRDGVWTIVTDKPRATTSQFFTPHNSWGFESTKTLPTIPHAFRVPFINSEQGFQPDEYIVYNDGYDSTNATLYEEINFNGVTTREAIHKHARFHFAQIKLRPETYTINADIEHLVCTRGDLVKVSHDVPMWGVGTGRIKAQITSTQIELDEPVAMVANLGYAIRIRLADGTNVVRSVDAKLTDGYYTTIDLTASVSALEAETGNLFMFGALDSETVDLIVQSIEPISNLTARITLVDYSPAVYDSDTETIPAFTSKISKPPTLLQQKIYVAPTIGTIVSDESVMVVLAPKTYMYRIKVVFTNPATLPFIAKYVEGQIDYAGDTSIIWQTTKTIPIRDGCIYFDDVQESSVYTMRLRYVTDDGRAGPWAYTADHTVIGKTTVPSTPTGLTATVSGTKILLQWNDNSEPDIYGYEVRATNAGWGTAGYLYQGVSSECLIDVGTYGVAEDYFVKAIDVLNLYSVNPASVIFTPSVVPAVSAVNFAYRSSSLTTTDLILSWTDVTPQFGLDYYAISFNGNTINARTSTITLNVDWVGARVFSVVAVDNNGRSSASTSVTVTKVAPAAPPSGSSAVVSDLLMLTWSPSVRTTLPITGYEIRTADSGWGSSGYIFKGDTLNFAVTPALGANTYFIRSFDTDNQYSTTSLSVSYTRLIPVAPTVASPAYVFSDNLTNATVTLDWNDVTPIFGLNQYKISYGSEIVYSKSSTITVPANWLGDQVFSIQTIDQLNGTSNAVNITVPKLAPNPASGLRTQVIDNNVLLYWTLPTKTTLPIQDVQLRKGAVYATAEVIGFKNGTFTSIQELSAGNYTYWVAVRDTDNRFSDPVSITSQVAQPPDFVFNAQYFSTFSGTKSSAINEQGGVLLPVSTTETWTEHFNRNLLTYSQDFTNAVWVKSGTTVTANSTTAPNGTTTASTILQTTSGYLNYATGTPFVSSLMTFSFYAKASTSTWALATLKAFAGGTETAWFNLSTGVVGTVGANLTASMVSVGNGWYRCIISKIAATTTEFVIFAPATSNGNTTNTSAQIFAWGAQLEQTSAVRTYIATTTTAALWADPAAQIAAGYPIFIQPNNDTGSYVEVFDYGTILGSSQITLNFQGTVIAATPTISFDIGISQDNITYTTTVGAQSIFATNFRYIKITANVTTTSATGLYLLQSMNVLLNAKLITDAGTVNALSTDASGTIVNFSKEFVDVISITISPNGSTLLTPVYDFKDSVLTGTYSVTSNVLTVNVTAHGLIAGQKVRLNFSSGTAPNGVYTVATLVNANQYTVNLTTANTSGNISTYPESFRVYLFNSAGVRTSGSVSWNVRGY